MKNISPKEALDILSTEPNSVLVDVRTPFEWDDGVPATPKLELVTLLPNSEEFEQNLQDKLLSQEAKILFICKGGMRSASAASIAEKLGYKDCYNIAGGFIEWKNSNLPFKDWRIK